MSSRSVTVAGLLLGIGLGGFVDGIVIHQLLQWHHMGTGDRLEPPFADGVTVSTLEDNTVWDGLFHAGTWVITVLGLFVLWRSLAAGHRTTWISLVGLLLAGWGTFNVVEGLVNHQLFGIHHLRDDLGGPIAWDVGFLLFGALLIVVGLTLRRVDERRCAVPAR
jgi:uncharacterized membrane protein